MKRDFARRVVFWCLMLTLEQAAASSYKHAVSRYLFLTHAVALTVSGSVEMTDDEDVSKFQLHKLVNYVHL